MTYYKWQVQDNAYGQLQTSASAAATSITLQSGHWARFPAFSGSWFIWTLVQYDINNNVAQKERVQVTWRSSDVISITRGYGGDTALDFDANDYFYLFVTAPIISDIQDEVTRLWTAKLDAAGWLRTALTNRRLYYSNGSGAETALAFGTSWQVLQSNGASSAPTFVSPTVDISALTEDTSPDWANDFVLTYDASASGNKKVKPNNLPINITWLTQDTAPASWDFVPTYDVSASGNKKVTASDFVKAWLWITIGTTTRLTSDSTGSQTIAHGLGKVPKMVRFSYVKSQDAATNAVVGKWFANGSVNYTIGVVDIWASAAPDMDTSKCIRYEDSSSVWWTATATMDATNITISRTKWGAWIDLDVIREAEW